MTQNAETGALMEGPQCMDCGTPAATWDDFRDHAIKDHPGQVVTWRHQGVSNES